MTLGKRDVKRSKEITLDNGYVKFTETARDDRSTVVTKETRTVYASPWHVEVVQCYCCTCREDDYGMLSNDAACRNHGFAGTRPCDIHGTAGSEWDDEMIPNPDNKPNMPMPVQAYRDAIAAGLPTW